MTRLIASGCVNYRIVSVVPDPKIDEFVGVPTGVGLVEVDLL